MSAQQTYKHMYEHGLKPHLLINNIHRSHVDLNRYMDKGVINNVMIVI